MDTYCPFCGEPIDIAEFHHPPDARTCEEATADFRRFGCGWTEGSRCTAQAIDPQAAAATRAAMGHSPHPEDWAGEAATALGRR